MEIVATFDSVYHFTGRRDLTIVSVSHARPVRVCRFVFTGPWERFYLSGFCIGDQVQWPPEAAVPADTFQAIPKAYEEVVELLYNARARSLWLPNYQIRLEVENRRPEPARFCMVVYGELQ